jgi:hypothetical protein
MKNLLKLAVLAIVIVAINACGSKTETPEAVATTFLGHLNKKEYAKAKELGTDQTKEYLATLESFDSFGGDQEKKEVKIENMKCTTTEEKANCTYLGDGKEETIDLLKKDGKWLVDMKKEATDTPTEPVVDSTATVPAE